MVSNALAILPPQPPGFPPGLSPLQRCPPPPLGLWSILTAPRRSPIPTSSHSLLPRSPKLLAATDLSVLWLCLFPTFHRNEVRPRVTLAHASFLAYCLQDRSMPWPVSVPLLLLSSTISPCGRTAFYLLISWWPCGSFPFFVYVNGAAVNGFVLVVCEYMF